MNGQKGFFFEEVPCGSTGLLHVLAELLNVRSL
jgi:hypothetical protein